MADWKCTDCGGTVSKHSEHRHTNGPGLLAIARAIDGLADAIREHTKATRDYRPPDLYGPRGTEIRRGA